MLSHTLISRCLGTGGYIGTQFGWMHFVRLSIQYWPVNKEQIQWYIWKYITLIIVSIKIYKNNTWHFIGDVRYTNKLDTAPSDKVTHQKWLQFFHSTQDLTNDCQVIFLIFGNNFSCLDFKKKRDSGMALSYHLANVKCYCRRLSDPAASVTV